MGGGDLSDPLPSWVTDAERLYRTAQVFPGWTRQETDDLPGVVLDRVIQIDGVHKRVQNAG